LGGDIRRDSVPLQDPIGLVAIQSQRVGELAMGNPFLALEVDQIDLLRLAVHVHSIGLEPLLEIMRYFKADRHLRISHSFGRALLRSRPCASFYHGLADYFPSTG